MSEANDLANQLVIDNLALIGYHVNEHASRIPSHITRADLASAASLSLVKASRSYNPELGVPFAKYASLRIRGAILDELRAHDPLSRQARQRARELSRVREQLTAGMGRVPTRDELADAMGTSVSAVEAAMADADGTTVSIDEEGTLGAFASQFIDANAGPEEVVLATEQLTYLHAAIDCLPERLQTVVRELFFNNRTLTELAEEFGVTHSRISQMRSEAIAMLRDGLAATLDPESAPAPPARTRGAEQRRNAYVASVAAQAAQASRASTLTALRQSRERAAAAAAIENSRPHLRVLEGGGVDRVAEEAA